MLLDLIQDRILFLEKASSWEEAIRKSSTPLLDQNFIEESYVEAMIDDILEFGSFIILTDGVAMPHSRPENGALKTGLSFLKLEQGVLFPNTEIPVHLIFTLCASDAEAQIITIMTLADIIGQEKTLPKLLQVTNKDEFIKIIGGDPS